MPSKQNQRNIPLPIPVSSAQFRIRCKPIKFAHKNSVNTGVRKIMLLMQWTSQKIIRCIGGNSEENTPPPPTFRCPKTSVVKIWQIYKLNNLNLHPVEGN